VIELLLYIRVLPICYDQRPVWL